MQFAFVVVVFFLSCEIFTLPMTSHKVASEKSPLPVGFEII